MISFACPSSCLQSPTGGRSGARTQTSFSFGCRGDGKIFLLPSNLDVFRLSYCRFGTSWRKDTRAATNTVLAGPRMLCKCGNRGQKLDCCSRALSERFAKMLALATAIKAGWCSSSRLSIAGCARSKAMRIGEATNHGPARRFAPRQSLHAGTAYHVSRDLSLGKQSAQCLFELVPK